MGPRTGCSTPARTGRSRSAVVATRRRTRSRRSEPRTRPSAAQVHGRDSRHASLFRRDRELLRRGRRGRTVETCGLSFDPVRPEQTREWMRKDVREFIRRLEAAGLTVEPTPGHYRVLREGKRQLRASTSTPRQSGRRPTRRRVHAAGEHGLEGPVQHCQRRRTPHARARFGSDHLPHRQPSTAAHPNHLGIGAAFAAVENLTRHID
jgi:hypothetical protein